MEYTTTENKDLKEKIIGSINSVPEGKNSVVRIPERAVLDEDLSLEALGVYVRIYSLEDFSFNALTLSKLWDEPARFMEECLDELKEKGYIGFEGGES